jgi:hypothetical protein
MLEAAGCVEHSFRSKDEAKEYGAITYGAEDEDWGAASGKNCGDCNCAPGRFHHAGCDVERCPRCGGQALGCDCHLLDDKARR